MAEVRQQSTLTDCMLVCCDRGSGPKTTEDLDNEMDTYMKDA